jgi:hypothetical protein
MFSIFKKKSSQQNIADEITLGANAEDLSKFSQAGTEYVKSFTGYDGVLDQQLKKSLSGIASGKPNLPSQKGFAAEVQDVARRNVEEILKGSDIRYSRVDDIPGHAVNETPFDIMAITKDGKEIISLGSQMKFNQGYPASVVDTLTGPKYREKYPHGQYSVPSDRCEAIRNALSDKIKSLEDQLKTAKADGKTNIIVKLQERIDYAKKVKENLVESKLTLKEAENAVLHPLGTTVGEVARLGHEVGVNYAKSAALIRGSMTFARCLNQVIKGEMGAGEATKEVAKEATKAAALGYVTGQANTALAAIMRNSSNEIIRKLGTSSAPAQIIAFSISAFRIVNERLEGKISDEECFHGIAKAGIGVVGTYQAGAIGAKIGGSIGALGGPVGAIVGSVIAGVFINSTYDYAVATLKAPGLAKLERFQIEKECDQLRIQLKEYRDNFRHTFVAHTSEVAGLFGNTLRDMALALEMEDADSFILGSNTITQSLGGKTQFDSVDGFKKFLDSDEPLDL